MGRVGISSHSHIAPHQRTTVGRRSVERNPKRAECGSVSHGHVPRDTWHGGRHNLSSGAAVRSVTGADPIGGGDEESVLGPVHQSPHGDRTGQSGRHLTRRLTGGVDNSDRVAGNRRSVGGWRIEGHTSPTVLRLGLRPGHRVRSGSSQERWRWLRRGPGPHVVARPHRERVGTPHSQTGNIDRHIARAHGRHHGTLGVDCTDQVVTMSPEPAVVRRRSEVDGRRGGEPWSGVLR